MSMQVRSLALLIELRILRCCELWCRSQTWLRSRVAVALAWAGSCRPLAWEPPYAAGAAQEIATTTTTKDKKKNKIKIKK